MDLYSSEDIYEMVVPKDDFWRFVRDNIDITPVVATLTSRYSADMGRVAYPPSVLLKLLILKEFYELSDADTVAMANVNLSHRLFLGLKITDPLPDKTTLSYFRRIRLKDADLGNDLISLTLDLAVRKGLLRKRGSRIIVKGIYDATHVRAYGNKILGVDCIQGRISQLSKAFRQTVGEEAFSIGDKIPPEGGLAAVLAFADEFLKEITVRFPAESRLPKIAHVINRLTEELEDIRDHGYTSHGDPQARIGHKSRTKSFFGYKVHLGADADSGLIYQYSVTPGNGSDTTEGYDMLVRATSPDSKVKLEAAIGDSAYSSKDILEVAEGKFEVFAAPNPNLGMCKAEKEGFVYVKDADTYRCPADRLAVSVSTVKDRRYNSVSRRYRFDSKTCRECPLRERCHVGKSKKNSMDVTVLTDCQKKLLRRQNDEDFRQTCRLRPAIERINADLKNNQSFSRAITPGLQGMTLQTVTGIFTHNLRKIQRFIREKTKKTEK